MEQRTLRTPRQSINYAVNPLPDSFDWNKCDFFVVDLEGESLDSCPLALKSASGVQPEVAQPSILEEQSSYAKVYPTKRKSFQKQSKNKKKKKNLTNLS
jgi:hypothetical protein